MALSERELTELIRLLTGPRRQSLPAWLRPVVAALKGERSRLAPKARQALDVLETIERQTLFPTTKAPEAETPEPPSNWPKQTTSQPAPVPPTIQTRTRVPQGFPEEQQNFSDEFLTPTSSNVYSFQFYRPPGQAKGILYVTYKGNRIRGESEGRQIRGQHGSTVGSKVNKPGSTYAYFDVPLSVFEGMKSAYSKGSYVWDALRVRHTVWGARYRYQLIVGQIVKAGGGLAQYVPRKAGRKGFVTRSVADIGTGRRGFVTSTLPAPKTGHGYSTMQARGGR